MRKCDDLSDDDYDLFTCKYSTSQLKADGYVFPRYNAEPSGCIELKEYANWWNNHSDAWKEEN